MKYIIILLSVSILSFKLSAQHSCCNVPATTEFASLGNKEEFQKQHAAPLPFNYEAERGVMISFKTSDGKDGNAFLVKADKPTKKYVLMIHEWWGLNDYIKKEAEKLQNELGDVNVLAIDLYDGKIAGDAEVAGQYMKETKGVRCKNIINGALDYVGKDAEVATIGWCFGGGWSMQTALFAGSRNKACVIFYGMPEKELKKLKNLSGKTLGIFATKDNWINMPIVAEFEKNMKDANKPLTVKWYEADHAFANPSNPHYNSTYAFEAHKMAVNFIKENL